MISQLAPPRETAPRRTRNRMKSSRLVFAEATMSEDPGVRVPPTIDDIRERAYFIYLNRCANGVPGDAQSDWLQAVAELNGDRGWA